MRYLLITCVGTLGIIHGAVSHAADWGSLKGKVVVDGSVGKPADINVTKDVEFCSKHDLKDETVVVGDNGGLENVVVYIYTRRGQTLDVNPEYPAPDSEPALIDNKGCRFEPHIVAVRAGQTLEVHNNDQGIGHNTNATFVNNPDFNQIVPNDAPLKIELQRAEPQPAPVHCNVHPWMHGYLVVRDDPYVAITDENGEFEIKDIPAGQHQFVFWHETGYLRNLKVDSAKTDRRGRAKLKIPAGDTLDLGEIKVKPADLGK